MIRDLRDAPAFGLGHEEPREEEEDRQQEREREENIVVEGWRELIEGSVVVFNTYKLSEARAEVRRLVSVLRTTVPQQSE